MSGAGNTGTASARESERAAEQTYLQLLYARLDEARTETEAELKRVQAAPTSGTPAARSERDAFAALHAERLSQLRAVEDRLCFGRLDLRPADPSPSEPGLGEPGSGEPGLGEPGSGEPGGLGERRYVGRLGLSDPDRTPLLLDWRAPAAEPFYRATAAQPNGVIRRRHLSTRGREVTGIEDEVLDLDAFDRESTVAGEGALFVALNAARTGHMRDIVATIQAEQDRIIRAPLEGVLVVEGGPGTGKTAVALHRAAYLLYTYRDRIAKSGVLLVGPNRVFLRYIEQVLPSLGENGVVMATPGQLFGGLDATGSESPETAALKGDSRLVSVIETAVRHRQRIPDRPRVLEVEGTVLRLRPRDVDHARAKAQRSGKPHNTARVLFVRELLGRLAQQYARALGTELTGDNRAELLASLRESKDVRREVNLCWMPLTPRKLLADLYAHRDKLAAAAPGLTSAERNLLFREHGSAWTPADVPLLDEAAGLLGEDDESSRQESARLAAARRSELDYARGVMNIFGGGELVTADELVDRYAAPAARRSVADQAAEDREWTFGHVVVDEAQELSPMLWRLLMRRCPTRSMTVVGDIAQTGSLAGAHSWGSVLDPYVAGRWRREVLTVNYRTPRQIMELASDYLRRSGISALAPESARESEWPPVFVRVPAEELVSAVTEAVRAELELLGEGRIAVITARADCEPITAAIAGLITELVTGSSGTGLPAAGLSDMDERVAVFAVADIKGLEFDAVVLVEPLAIQAESIRGASDVYVALTRPTQRLRIVHTSPDPLS